MLLRLTLMIPPVPATDGKLLSSVSTVEAEALKARLGVVEPLKVNVKLPAADPLRSTSCTSGLTPLPSLVVLELAVAPPTAEATIGDTLTPANDPPKVIV